MKQEIFNRWIEVMKGGKYQLNFNNPIGFIEVNEDGTGLICHPLGILVLIACKEDIVTLDQDNVVQFIDHKFIRVLEGEKRYISKLPKSVIEWAGMTDGCHSYTSIYDWPSMYHHSLDQIIDWMTTALM